MTKLAAEHLCVLYGDEHGVDTVALRYFSVYGPRQRPDMAFRRFCEAIVAGAPIEVFGDGRQTRDFTYVGDIVAATRAAGETPTTPPGRVYNIGGGDAREPQRARSRCWPGSPGARSTCAAASASPATCATRAPTPSARAAELGFAPATDLEAGLAAELAWVRERAKPVAAVRSLTAS